MHGTVLAEEVFSHVVVDADDLQALFMKEFRRFATDQSR